MGLVSKLYATDNFFFIVMIPVSVFLTSLPETDITGSSLGGMSGTVKNQFFLDSTFAKRFFNSVISFLSLSTVFPTVPQSFTAEATDLDIDEMVVWNSLPWSTSLSTASTEVFIDRNLTNSVDTAGASL